MLKILLIDNQETQYSQIRTHLAEYKVFPAIEEYLKFIDNVRVWINIEYERDYREKAIQFVQNYILQNGIDLIVMDHKLGGAHHCLSGIELAKEINSNRGEFDTIPIVFLSKTEHTEHRVTAYDEYKSLIGKCDWAHKGYFGDEILNKNYFNKIVITKINQVSQDSKEKNFRIKLNNVLTLSFPPVMENIVVELKRINKEKFTSYSADFMSLIDKVYSTKQINLLKLDFLKNV